MSRFLRLASFIFFTHALCFSSTIYAEEAEKTAADITLPDKASSPITPPPSPVDKSKIDKDGSTNEYPQIFQNYTRIILRRD